MKRELAITPQNLWALCLRTADAIQVGQTFRVARLLFGTCAQESNLTYRRQIGFSNDSHIGGFSLWQLEHNSIYDSLQTLTRNESMRKRVIAFMLFERCNTVVDILSDNDNQFSMQDVYRMLPLLTDPGNDAFGCLLCRLHYLRVPAPVPATIEDQASYWKQHYNTFLGKGRAADYIRNYEYYSRGVPGAELNFK